MPDLTLRDIATLRLARQGISRPDLASPAAVVGWFGAVQSQDLTASLWAVGLRTPRASESAVETAIADKTVVRTWPMRGTIHLLPPEDAGWITRTLAPRVNKKSANIYRKSGLTAEVIERAGEVIARELKGGKQLVRNELYAALGDAGIQTSVQHGEQRGIHLLRHWAQEGLICVTPRRGKQQTFALFDEWVPPGRDLTGDAALAELAEFYFRAHGPATVHDFAWWTGLTVTEARRGAELVAGRFEQLSVAGAQYWLRAPDSLPRKAASRAHLLPPFDEYTVAYADRGAAIAPDLLRKAGYGIGPNIIIDGAIAGTWKRELKKDQVLITLDPLRPLGQGEQRQIAEAAKRYGAFLGREPVVQ